MMSRARAKAGKVAISVGAMFLVPAMVAGGYLLLATPSATATAVPLSVPAVEAPAPLPATPPPATVEPPAPAAAPAPALGSDYVVKRILSIDHAMKQGEYYWDEKGAPATGQIVITVDLAAQVLSVFRDGYEIGTAVVIYGGDDTPTPLGVFNISQKDADHVSNIYNAPMPHMLRLTNDGISIHGSEVGNGYVTHGCVGTPAAFARLLFGAVKLGDRVIVSRGETLGLGQAIKAAQ